jgi:hypothetical protein
MNYELRNVSLKVGERIMNTEGRIVKREKDSVNGEALNEVKRRALRKSKEKTEERIMNTEGRIRK